MGCSACWLHFSFAYNDALGFRDSRVNEDLTSPLTSRVGPTKGEWMFARLARYEIPADRLGDAVESFVEAGAGLADLDGFEHGYVLVDEEGESLMTLTLWHSLSALEASSTRAGALRQRAVRDAGGSVEAIQSYEVAGELGGDSRSQDAR